MAAEPEPEIFPGDHEPAMMVEVVHDHEPALLECEELPTIGSNRHVKEKVLAVGATLLLHAVLVALLGVLFVVLPSPPSSEITALSAPSTSEQTPVQQKVVEQPPQPTVSQSVTNMKFLTAVSTSAVAMPTVNFDSTSDLMDLGTSMGSFDTNLGGSMGGTISFMGNSGQGRRVVFAVDASKSMGNRGKGKNKAAISKFDLMKQELDDSIRKLPPGTEYQILFFSAFAWPHDEIDTNNQAQWNGYRWTIKIGEENPKLPKFKYLKAVPENTKKSREIIKNSQMTLGTLWGPPVLMALSIRPKPDVVFFMTDGTTGNPKGWIEMINRANKKGGKRATIHTTAMMEPDAAQDLSDLAKANGGEFTIVQADGKTIKGDDFFKQQAKN